MRDLLKRRVGWPTISWLSVLVLLALPDCSLDRRGLGTFVPRTTLVFCDIENGPTVAARHCATPEEIAIGVRQASAAVALATGQTMDISLDESAAAVAACGGPQAVYFMGPFPEGQGLCASATAIGPGGAFADANAFCVQQCKNTEMFTDAFCDTHSVVSTNVPKAPDPVGFAGGCTPEGTKRTDFVDPRRTPEPVVWSDLIGTTASTNNLTRTAPTSAPPASPPFDAGAVSTQWITHGDAYVEFSALENNLSHVLGLSVISPPGCAFPCTDSDPSLTDINFSVSLNKDGRFYVIAGGVLVPGLDVNGSYGTYAAGDRFRVSVKQSATDSTSAIVTYSRLTGSCMSGSPCPTTEFFASPTLATYPLRVDASFREANATLTDVRLVRIQ